MQAGADLAIVRPFVDRFNEGYSEGNSISRDLVSDPYQLVERGLNEGSNISRAIVTLTARVDPTWNAAMCDVAV